MKVGDIVIYPLPTLPKFLCLWSHRHVILAVETFPYTELEEVQARLMGETLKRFWKPVTYCKRCKRLKK